MSARAKGTVWLLLAFVLGVTVGGLGLGVYHARAGGSQRGGTPEAFQARLLQRLTTELNLRPDQREQVQAVLRDSGREFARLREEMRPRYQEIRARSRERMLAVLDPEQQVKFEALRAEWQRRAERWRGRGPAEGPAH